LHSADKEKNRIERQLPESVHKDESLKEVEPVYVLNESTKERELKGSPLNNFTSLEIFNLKESGILLENSNVLPIHTSSTQLVKENSDEEIFPLISCSNNKQDLKSEDHSLLFSIPLEESSTLKVEDDESWNYNLYKLYFIINYKILTRVKGFTITKNVDLFSYNLLGKKITSYIFKYM
jgi:hypothetical protein